jgi:aminobenzoyl-glutamate utilization protein B
MEKKELFAEIEDRRADLEALATTIWETPELGLHEEESARTLGGALKDAGFSVDYGVGDLSTAFIASYGSGEPEIGVLGEYDALPGLSQSVSTERDPIEPGGPGHGCGHNLHGTGAVGGAIAAKHFLEATDNSSVGTIKYFGCPAEEILVGKPYMAREGVFDGLDAALAWHPSDLSTVRFGTANALNSIEYQFTGEAAHAAASPEAGRSALDAVELLNIGVEYLREHIPNEARIHHVITDGGNAPNVVPADAAVWYYIRASTRETVENLTDRITDVARGAALMTDTEVSPRFVTGCYDYQPNETLGWEVWKNMKEVGEIEYTTADLEFASELQTTIDEDDRTSRLSRLPDELREEVHSNALHPTPVEPFDNGYRSPGTADLGDVSWIAPTVQFRGATWPVGTPAHTWQAVAANGGYGRTAVVFAAKVFAGTIYDLLTDHDLRDQIQAGFTSEIGDAAYESPLPDETTPPFDMTA